MKTKKVKKLTRVGAGLKRKLLSLCLTLALVAGMMPMITQPAYAAGITSFYVGNTRYETPWSSLPENISASFDTVNDVTTITLNNYEGPGISTGIAETRDVTIHLVGKNVLTASNEGRNGHCLFVMGHLTITADEGASLDLVAGTKPGTAERGIQSKGLKLKGGKVTVHPPAADLYNADTWWPLSISGPFSIEGDASLTATSISNVMFMGGYTLIISTSGDVNLKTTGKDNLFHSVPVINLSGTGTYRFNTGGTQLFKQEPFITTTDEFNSGHDKTGEWNTPSLEYIKKGESVAITGVTVNPATATVSPGQKRGFTANVTGTGAFNTDVTWSVSDGEAAGTSINSSGLLTVASDETATTLTVKATSAGDSTKSATATVTVSQKITPVITVNPITVTYTGTSVANTSISGTAMEGATPVDGAWSFTETVPTDAGTHNVGVKFTPTDTNKYNTISGNVTLTIQKATPTGTPTYTKITSSGKTLADAALVVGSIMPTGTIAWNDGDTKIVDANTAYNWTFTPTDETNYNTLTGSITPYVVSTTPPSGGGGGSYTSSTTEKSIEIVKDMKNGTVESNIKKAKPGDTVILTPKPDAGYEVKTIKVADKSGKAIAVVKNMDDTFSFKMPNTEVTVEAEFVPLGAPSILVGYTDVKPGDWFYDNVSYVIKNKLMVGTATGEFSPNIETSRAMIVTILYRLAGSPKVIANSKFSDVADGEWYTDAISWAAENKIVRGFPDGNFRPDSALTREQLVTILFNFAQMKGYDTTGTELSAFKDADKVASYTLPAMKWAVKHGIVNGIGEDLISPATIATRAQMAAILQRYIEDFAK